MPKLVDFSQVGFRKLCCLWIPDISPEKASASHISSNYYFINARERNGKKLKDFLFQIYIPCCLFVSVSWISFVIDPKVGVVSRQSELRRQGRNDGHVFLTPSLKFHNIALELGPVAVKRRHCEEGGFVKHASIQHLQCKVKD